MTELWEKWNKNNKNHFKNNAEKALQFALDMQKSIYRDYYLNDNFNEKDKKEDK